MEALNFAKIWAPSNPFVHYLSPFISSIYSTCTLFKIHQNLAMNPSHADVLILWDFHVTISQAYHSAMSRESTPAKGKDKKKMRYQYDQ